MRIGVLLAGRPDPLVLHGEEVEAVGGERRRRGTFVEEAVEPVAMVPDGDPARLEQLREAGFDHAYVVGGGRSLDHALQRLERLATRVL